MHHNPINQYLFQEEELADPFGVIAGDLGWNNFLAFFIIALTLVAGTMKALDVRLAETGQEGGSEPSPAATVSIDADGNLAIDGERLASTVVLRQRLTARVRATPQNPDGGCQKVMVVPDRETPWQSIVTVRDVVVEATNEKGCVILAKGKDE